MNKYLNTFDIFNDLSENDIELFTSHMKIIKYKKNDTIISEGEEGNSLLFVLEGKVIITQALTLATNKLDEGDNREKQITNLNSKDHKIMLGEIALFSPDKKRKATVKAVVDCEVARLPFDEIFTICNENNTVGYKLMRNLSEIVTKNLIDSNHKVLKLTTAFSLLIDH